MMKILLTALISVFLLSSCGRGGGGGGGDDATPPPVVVEDRITFEIELVHVMVRRPSDNTLIAVDVSGIPTVELALID